jgi:hypothetical protein
MLQKLLHMVSGSRGRAVFGGVILLAAFILAPHSARAQETDAAVIANQNKARAVLDQMVKALGGDAWLTMKFRYTEGRRTAFYHGNPTGGIVDSFEYHVFPDQDCIQFTKKKDVVTIISGQQGWEITYRGKRDLPKEQLESALRRRDHSVEVAVKVWLKDPRTILFYDGQRTVQRHLADKVRIINAENDSITIEMDAESHLPVRRTFQWRDPVYKDKNETSEEYDDYHTMDGFPTPFTITDYENGEMVGQRFLFKASYNMDLPPDIFNPDATAAKIKK